MIVFFLFLQFLPVPAHPGSRGQRAVKQLLLLCCFLQLNSVCHILHCRNSMSLHWQQWRKKFIFCYCLPRCTEESYYHWQQFRFGFSASSCHCLNCHISSLYSSDDVQQCITLLFLYMYIQIEIKTFLALCTHY